MSSDDFDKYLKEVKYLQDIGEEICQYEPDILNKMLKLHDFHHCSDYFRAMRND